MPIQGGEKGGFELRNLTGWDDEQIEGWRIMLERTVIVFFFFRFSERVYLSHLLNSPGLIA